MLSRRQRSTCSTDGDSRNAASTVSSIGIRAPRRSDQSAVTIALASESCSRCTIAVAANPEKIGT
jgi:hypothetical protein